MARFGQYRALTGTPAQAGKLTTPDVIGLHTMAGSLAGTDALFVRNGYGGVFSHFGVGGAGQLYQWQDTALRAAANLDGNHRVISIETADRGETFPAWSGEDVPAWTDAQLEALAQLIAGLCDAHDIPCVLLTDSRPGRRGIAPHRLGTNPWRAPDGELWSSARGKVCPGERRLAQIPALIDRARQLLTPGDDMPLTPADIDAVATAVTARLLATPLNDMYPAKVVRTMTVADTLAWAAAHAARGEDQAFNASQSAAAARTDIAALAAQIKSLPAVAGGVDPDAVAERVLDGLAARLQQ